MPAFFCNVQFVKQSSVLLVRAFLQKTMGLHVEQALLLKHLKQSVCAPSKPLFSVQSLAGTTVVAIWLCWQTKTIHTFAYLRLRLWWAKADCYTPRWQLNSTAVPFKLDRTTPRDELTHDTKAVGDARKCCKVQQCKCLNEDFWLLESCINSLKITITHKCVNLNPMKVGSAYVKQTACYLSFDLMVQRSKVGCNEFTRYIQLWSGSCIPNDVMHYYSINLQFLTHQGNHRQ